MYQSIARFPTTPSRLPLLIGTSVCTLLATAYFLAAGTPGKLVLAALIGSLPFTIYSALRCPQIFPYGLYVGLVPFDAILGLSHSGPSTTITRLIALVAAPVLIFWCIRVRRWNPPPLTVWILGGLLSWMLLSVFWAYDQQAATSALFTLGGLAALYVAVSLTPISIGEYRIVLLCIAAGGVVAALYGAHTFYQHPPVAATTPQQLLSQRLLVQVDESTIDQNHYANALLFPIAIIAMFALRSRSVLRKLAGLAAVGAITYAILLSASREALMAEGAILLYFLWRGRQRLQILGCIVAIVAFALSAGSSVWARFQHAVQQGGDGRTAIWHVGFRAFKEHWLLGSGIGSFPTVYDDFYLKVHQYFPDGWDRPAHNIIIHYGVELGVLGLGLIVAFYFLHFYLLRDIDRSNDLYDARVMIEASLVALTLVSLFIDLFNYKYAWIIFAAAIQLYALSKQQRATRSSVRARS